MTQTQTIYSSEKFQSAEQLWFWFLYSKSIRNNFQYRRAAQTRRPCEILDVETLITKLYLCGKLSDDDLSVMKRFGDKKRAPHQHIWSENRAVAIWEHAMSVLQDAAKKRGWID